MALQHLRSSTAHKRPVPGNMSDGQLGINTNTGSPGLFFKDSNNTLVKVGPVHVGTTAPNASPAAGGTAGNSVGEQWLDTTGGTYVFKVWDGSAWRSESGTFVDVNGDVMTGALGIIAGSASAPGLYFSGDTNTGIYSPGADQVAISTNGTGRLFVDANGNVGVGTSSPDGLLTLAGANSNIPRFRIQHPSSDRDAAVSTFFDGSGTYLLVGSNHYLNSAGSNTKFDATSGSAAWYLDGSGTGIFYNSSGSGSVTERLRITSDGKLGLGTSSPAANLHVAGTTGVRITGIPDKITAGIYLPTGGILGDINDTFEIRNGGGASSELRLSSRGKFSVFIGGGGDLGGGSERVTVTSAGNVGVGTSTPAVACDVVGQVRASTGILFGSDTAAANALNDYEEGTFTPTIVGTSTAGTATYGSNGQQGRYTKIGNRVFFDLYLAWSAHTGTGDLQINGLPFTVQNTTNLNRTYSVILSNVAMSAGNIGAAFSSPNTTTIALRQMPTGGGSVANIPMDTSAQISISGSFDV